MCAVKSIIDVQVNSAEFEKFYNKFEEYSAGGSERSNRGNRYS